LNKLYDKFYTEKAIEIGREQQKTMDCYFKNLFKEVNNNYSSGIQTLDKVLD